ncbi:MAG: FtsQ-type POTRA domain-containing protein [Blastocatellia bacterium]
MASSPNNENTGYSNLAARHHRSGASRSIPATQVITGAKTTSSARRRGLPEEYQQEAEEQDYQARYDQQWRERNEQRAAERREARKREIPAGRVEKRARKAAVSEAAKRWMYLSLIALAALLVLTFGVMAYSRLSGVQFFVVKEIELQGTKRASREEVLRSLDAYKMRGLWQLDLQALRTTVEKNPWVLEADVARVLPDAVRVTVHEREPVAPWRNPSNSIVWVDRDGRSLGELDFNQTDKVPPIINGLEEGASNELRAANRRRMETYQRLLTELDQGSIKLSESIDEVRLQEPQAVRVHLQKYNVDVLLGDAEFRARLEKALKVLDAIERKDLSTLGFYKITDAEKLVHSDGIAYLNVMHADRVAVGLK